MTVERNIRCDWCAKSAPMSGPRLPPGWFTLSRRGQDNLAPDNEHHFCSISCLKSWS